MGSETAAVVTLLLPVEPFPAPSVGIELNDAEAAVDFLGGFLEGFVENNHLDEIQACAKDIEEESTAVK